MPDLLKGPKIDPECARPIKIILQAKDSTVDVGRSREGLDVSKMGTPRTRIVGPTCRGKQKKIAREHSTEGGVERGKQAPERETNLRLQQASHVHIVHILLLSQRQVRRLWLCLCLSQCIAELAANLSSGRLRNNWLIILTPG